MGEGADEEFYRVRGGEKGHRGVRRVGGDWGKSPHMTTGRGQQVLYLFGPRPQRRQKVAKKVPLTRLGRGRKANKVRQEMQ
jgi:hypothetical protein